MLSIARRFADRARWEWRELCRPSRPSFLHEELDRAILDETAWHAGERVLDVGCGSGTYVASLALRGVCAYGIDTNTSALRRSPSALTLAAASALHLPFADDAFDTVLCHKTLYLFGSPRDAVRELARVVRPGGRVVFSTSNSHSPYQLVKKWSTPARAAEYSNWRSGNQWGLADWLRAFARHGLHPAAIFSCNLVWPIVFRVYDRWLIPNEWMRRYNRWIRRACNRPLRTGRPLGAAMDYVAVVQKVMVTPR